MKATVVIPSYNSGPRLGRLLRGLSCSRLDAADSFEVIVVDDGSTDGTPDVVAELTADMDVGYMFLPRTPSSGRPAARNAGIEKANGDVVVLIDADQVCAADFVAEHLRYHRQRTDLVVVGPRHDLADGPLDDEALARGFTLAALPQVIGRDGRLDVFAEFSENLNNLAICWHHMYGCNVSVRREHLIAAGGFDEGFTGWGLEDCELGYRLRLAGLAFACNPAAVTYQVGRLVTPEMFGEWRRNLTYFVGKHGGAAEVAVQSVIRRAFDPADRSIDWLESMRRLEFAAMALAGRLPGPAAFEWVEVNEDNAADVLESLPERASAQDLIVIDDSERAALSCPVQCIDTAREMLYFHRPGADQRNRIRSRYPVRSA